LRWPVTRARQTWNRNNASGRRSRRGIDGLVVAVFDVEMLGEAVFEFVGVGEGGVAVEANEIGEVVHAGDVAIGDGRLDGVFVAVARARAVEKTLQRGRAQLDRKSPVLRVMDSPLRVETELRESP